MDEKFHNIINAARDLFYKYGIRNVSMDDICKHVRISKKTLYKYVSNKDELVVNILDNIQKFHEDAEFSEMTKGKNAIEFLLFVSKSIYQFSVSTNNPFRTDLEKYYPEYYKIFRDTMQGKSHKYMMGNIKQGIEEGLYRESLGLDIDATLYLAKMDGVQRDFSRNPEKYTLRQLFEVLFENEVRALATPKGIEFLENELKNVNMLDVEDVKGHMKLSSISSKDKPI
jgi:AcrR family transcriptional regulator